MNNVKSLSQWLKSRRHELDLTQQELADRAHCSVVTIRKFENNSRRPSKQIAQLLADALDISPEDREAFLATARQTPSKQQHSRLTNIPVQPSPFIGRQHELRHIYALLDDPQCRLLTLVGPGGIGKTRLAIQVAQSLLTDYPDGVYLVPLASLPSPAFIVSAIAQAIGFVFYEQTDPQAQLIDYLRTKRLLLVLDNFEHLLSGSNLLTDILANTPHVKIIVTSWAYLNLKDEWIYHVQGLSFPEANISLGDAETFDAVQLFVQLAERLQLAPAEEEMAAIIRICQYVSGMPLAIELATGWLSTISCSQIAAHIAQDVDFLQRDSSGDLDWHQSLRAVFERTWKLMSAEERAVFMRLSIFRSGFTYDAAQTVAQATLPILKKLIEKSLISGQYEGRYSIHEFLRQFAYQQLEMFGALAETKAKFVSFYVSMAKQTELMLKTSQRNTAVMMINAEIDHLRLIRTWCQAEEVSLDDEVTLIACPWIYWAWYSRYTAEIAAWGEEIVQRAGSLRNIRSPMAFFTMGSISYSQGKYEYGLPIVTEGVEICHERNDAALGFVSAGKGITLLTVGNPEDALPVLIESVRVIRSIGEEWFLPIPLTGLALVHFVLGDVQATNLVFAEALEIAEKYGHSWEMGVVLYFAASCAFAQGDYPKARQQLERAINIQRSTDQIWSLANLLNAFGHIYRLENNSEQAQAAFQESLDLYRYLGNQRNVANLLLSLAKLALSSQQPEQSRALLTEGLQLCHEINYTSGLKSYLTVLADQLVAQGQFEHAASLFGMAEGFSDVPYDPLYAHHLFETPYDYAAARRTVEHEGFLEAWEQGARKSIDEVLKMLDGWGAF